MVLRNYWWPETFRNLVYRVLERQVKHGWIYNNIQDIIEYMGTLDLYFICTSLLIPFLPSDLLECLLINHGVYLECLKKFNIRHPLFLTSHSQPSSTHSGRNQNNKRKLLQQHQNCYNSQRPINQHVLFSENKI